MPAPPLAVASGPSRREGPAMTGTAGRWLVMLAAAWAVTTAALAAPAASGAAPTGYAVPIGGELRYDNTAVWSRLVQLSGGPGSRWVVIPAASSAPEKTGEMVVDALQRHGAQAVTLPVAPEWQGYEVAEAVHDPVLIEQVLSATGIYFAGGAQSRITDSLQPDGLPTPLLQAIWSVYRAGGVVAGTSAGAAVMSETMFRDAYDVLRVLKRGRLDEGQEIGRGLGFVGPELLIDQHFLKRGRIGRLLPLMVQKGYRLGLGVEENTAAILHDGGVEVVGGKGVLLVDLGAASQDGRLDAFNLRNAKLTYLDRGDRHDLHSGITTPSLQKLQGQLIDPGSPDFAPSFESAPFQNDMLGPSTIVNAMGSLLDNRDSEATGLAFSGTPRASDPQPDLGFEFRLRRGPDSHGWYTGAFGGDDYTVLNLYLDVTPITIARPLYSPTTASATDAVVPRYEPLAPTLP